MRLIESSFAPDNRWTIILIDIINEELDFTIICTHSRNIFKKEQRQKVAHWKNLPTITDLVSFFILFPIFLRRSCYSPSILCPSLFLSFSLSRALLLLLSLVTADQRESRPTHSPAICSSALFSRGTDGFILITPTLRTSFQVWFIRFKCVRFFFSRSSWIWKHHTLDIIV